MLAVEAPVRKLAVVAGAVLAIAAFTHRPSHSQASHHHRLTLHTETRAKTIYLTIFAEGRIERTASDLRTIEIDGEPREMQYKATTSYYGCEVEGDELLVRLDAHSYAYSYDENILSCDPNSDYEVIRTPRTGIVTVDD